MRFTRPAPGFASKALLLAGLLCWGSATATAQTGATTLGALTDRADAIVVVRALRHHADEGTRSVRFRVARTLFGEAPRSFTLSEPKTRACGRALHGVLPGVAHLAFLRRPKDGDPVLVASGARALPRLAPGLEPHVADLIGSKEDGPARAELLADSIHTARSARVVSDAAQDLAVHPSTVRLGLEQRHELRKRCEHEDTAPMLRYALAQVLARFDGPSDRAVLRRLGGDEDAWKRFVGRTALELSPSKAAARGTAATPSEKAPTFRSIRPRRRR